MTVSFILDALIANIVLVEGGSFMMGPLRSKIVEK